MSTRAMPRRRAFKMLAVAVGAAALPAARPGRAHAAMATCDPGTFYCDQDLGGTVVKCCENGDTCCPSGSPDQFNVCCPPGYDCHYPECVCPPERECGGSCCPTGQVCHHGTATCCPEVVSGTCSAADPDSACNKKAIADLETALKGCGPRIVDRAYMTARASCRALKSLIFLTDERERCPQAASPQDCPGGRCIAGQTAQGERTFYCHTPDCGHSREHASAAAARTAVSVPDAGDAAPVAGAARGSRDARSESVREIQRRLRSHRKGLVRDLTRLDRAFAASPPATIARPDIADAAHRYHGALVGLRRAVGRVHVRDREGRRARSATLAYLDALATSVERFERAAQAHESKDMIDQARIAGRDFRHAERRARAARRALGCLEDC